MFATVDSSPYIFQANEEEYYEFYQFFWLILRNKIPDSLWEQGYFRTVILRVTWPCCELNHLCAHTGVLALPAVEK